MKIGDIVRAMDLPRGVVAKSLNLRNPVVYQIADDVDLEALRRTVHVVDRGGISPTAIMIESRVMLRVTEIPSRESRIVRKPETDNSEPSLEAQLEAALDQAESAEAEIATLKNQLASSREDATSHLRNLLKSERALHKANQMLGLSPDQPQPEMTEPGF
jgi:hypothetical protein